MNAIVTVIGKDKVGIIAAVCIKLAEMNVNVLDNFPRPFWTASSPWSWR